MRSVEPGELIEAIVALLESQILPAVEDRSARSTLLLAVGMLDNLAGRVEEKRDLVERDTDAVRRLVTAIPDGLRPIGLDTEIANAEYRDLSAVLTSTFRALPAREGWLEDPEVDAWLDLCLSELRRRNAEEIALVRPTRYLRSQTA